MWMLRDLALGKASVSAVGSLRVIYPGSPPVSWILNRLSARKFFAPGWYSISKSYLLMCVSYLCCRPLRFFCVMSLVKLS